MPNATVDAIATQHSLGIDSKIGNTTPAGTGFNKARLQ
jgi:hypothetical protein